MFIKLDNGETGQPDSPILSSHPILCLCGAVEKQKVREGDMERQKDKRGSMIKLSKDEVGYSCELFLRWCGRS